MAEQELNIPGLTPEQIDTITASRLESLKDADWIPYPIYRAMMHMAVRYTVELALVKPSTDSSAEVLLIQRPADDEDIPNQWHIPGVGVKLQDPVKDYYDNKAALDRIITKEIGGDLQIMGNPVKLDTVRRKEYGLSEVTTQYWAKYWVETKKMASFLIWTEFCEILLRVVL